MIRGPEKRQLVGREIPGVGAAIRDFRERTGDGTAITLITTCLRSIDEPLLTGDGSRDPVVNLSGKYYV